MSDILSLVPERYRDVIADFAVQYYSRRKWELEQAFLGLQIQQLMPEALRGSALVDQLASIARAAEGKREHDEFNDGVLYEEIQDLMERLFAPPGLYYSYTIPSEFWSHPLGQMVARALVWLRHDELITLAEAAKLRGVTVQAISQAVDAGRLTRYVDPDAPARQGRTLVSRKEVEDLSG